MKNWLPYNRLKPATTYYTFYPLIWFKPYYASKQPLLAYFFAIVLLTICLAIIELRYTPV